MLREYRIPAIRQRGYVQDGWNLTGDAYAKDADGDFWVPGADRRHDRLLGQQHRQFGVRGGAPRNSSGLSGYPFPPWTRPKLSSR
jgi:hypothetical protein